MSERRAPPFALKWVFALEYAMQGVASPFLGITYQPLLAHFRGRYGLDEAMVQALFAKIYLAWSVKPLLGFLIDAYGQTRTALIALLSLAALGFLLAPALDQGPLAFAAGLFGLSVLLAATDVCVDRATVIAGDDEAQATGRSKATTVGLNQAVCWLSVYGTGVVSAVLGGWVSERVAAPWLMVALSAAPLLVLLAVWRLPRDSAAKVPLSRSLRAFWDALHTGPILGVMAFFFLFNFQPAVGPIWNNHLLESLHFTRAEVGWGDGATYAGYFAGVVLFVRRGVRLQERVGLKSLFRLYIVCAIPVRFTQFLCVDPWFSQASGAIDAALPFVSADSARLSCLFLPSFLVATAYSLMSMTTFSLVGAVVPRASAGSLFAGFMSIANLAMSSSYTSGAWLYEHGREIGVLASADRILFESVPSTAGKLSIAMLLLFNSTGYVLSFAAVNLLPGRRETQASGELDAAGPERWQTLGRARRRAANAAALGVLAVVAGALRALGADWVSTCISSGFFAVSMRKLLLDRLL